MINAPLPTPQDTMHALRTSMLEFKAAGRLLRSDWLLDHSVMGLAQELGLDSPPPVIEVVDDAGRSHSYRLQSDLPTVESTRMRSWIYVAADKAAAPSDAMSIKYRIKGR